MKQTILPVTEFLLCPTPDTWVTAALQDQATMLIDHAHCEKKAASTAFSLMYRYAKRYDLLQKVSRLAREELRHFEQVLKIMQQRGIDYGHLSPGRYAKGMSAGIRESEPQRLIDTLIVCGIIEARSCERFAVLIPHLDEELKAFYTSLLKSEARHYADYITLAREYAQESIDERVVYFLEKERELIASPDDKFRFHSGAPAWMEVMA